MGSRVRCFWLEPTGNVRLWLRRYSSSNDCAGSYHNAMFLIGDAPVVYGADGVNGRRYLASRDDEKPPADDARWPRKCERCDYLFAEPTYEICTCEECKAGGKARKRKTGGDEYQLFQSALYTRRDTGEVYTIESAPPGAMWDAWWMGGSDTRSPDGVKLLVKLPNGGEWWVDGPANNGPGWTRTGAPPDVTAMPSIFSRQGRPDAYHGWLRAGWLEEC